jgi:hypothetical protein
MNKVSLFAALAILLAPKAQAFNVLQVSPEKAPTSWLRPGEATVTIHWSLDPTAPPMLRESMLFVTDQWSQVTNGVVQFIEGPGDIHVLWDSEGKHFATNSYLGFASNIMNQDYRITQSEIQINAARVTWSRGFDRGIAFDAKTQKWIGNLDSVLLHEVGHSLGLGHSNYPADKIVGDTRFGNIPTMNSTLFRGASSLHEDDAAGARYLYPDLAGYGGTVLDPLFITAEQLFGRGKLLRTVDFKHNVDDLSCLWSFGDLYDDNAIAPRHFFRRKGTYVVSADCAGRKGSLTITVQNRRPRDRPFRAQSRALEDQDYSLKMVID